LATRTATQAPTDRRGSEVTGPPLLLLALGFLSVLVSLPLVAGDGTGTHVVGYVTGALVPILLVGVVRRTDLDRRRSPDYRARGFLRPALVVLMLASLVAAALHLWPIATDLAS
jgi:hypothetical protein